ncbi:MAG: NAD(P)-dependent oxidoreductase [Nitrososphaerota archaeon]|nr:NAD(P)-dependent oxidoreductase [Nitrososphaerota archaeon]
MAKPTVGLIGVGEMGLPMGINLISAGFPLVAYDVRPEANDEIRSKGAKIATSPADLTQSSDVIISILPNSKIVREVLVEGKDNVLSSLRSKHTVIEMSTLDVETTLELEKLVKQKGASFVDAPISGVPERVKTRDIIILSSGDKPAVDNCTDVLNALGKTVEYVGEAGKGKIVKLINNYLVATHKIATTEAVCYALKNGIDPNLLLKIIGEASGKSDAFMRFAPVIVNGNKSISDKHSWHSKDLKLINEECNRLGIPLMLGSLSYQITLASANELGAENFGALVSFYKKLMKV